MDGMTHRKGIINVRELRLIFVIDKCLKKFISNQGIIISNIDFILRPTVNVVYGRFNIYKIL